MDKKSIIGIVLMIALFVGFSFYQSHEIEEQQKIVREKAKVEQAERAQQLADAEAERMLEEQMTAEERLERDSIAELERTNAEVARHGPWCRPSGIRQNLTIIIVHPSVQWRIVRPDVPPQPLRRLCTIMNGRRRVKGV